ncbi:MAG: carbonic anhydrase [Clostridium sp.]|uniref:carbonic anhydrase n=1 Tax=Clostridium sp. TaxID=1506 RepID=UPI003F2CEDAD
MKKKAFIITLILCLSSILVTGFIKESTTTEASTKVAPSSINLEQKTPDEALQILKDGNTRFFNDKSYLMNVDKDRREQLKSGQNPYAVVVSCSDSRVSPPLIFNAGLGDLFEIRLAGNVIDTDVLASIEYAVKYLNTPLIVIVGHEDCGAVKSAYDMIKNGEVYSDNIIELLKKIEPSVRKSSTIEEAIKLNIFNSASLISEDSIINSKIHTGKLKVIKGYYNLDGKVDFLL